MTSVARSAGWKCPRTTPSQYRADNSAISTRYPLAQALPHRSTDDRRAPKPQRNLRLSLALLQGYPAS
jgi:hypothetical protein